MIINEHYDNVAATRVLRELERLKPGDRFFFHSKRKHEAPTYLLIITKREYEADDDESKG